MTKAEKVRSLLAEGKSIKQVAKLAKCKNSYVYYVRWMDEKGSKKAKKKLAKGTKTAKAAKPVKHVEPVEVSERAKQWRKDNPWFGKNEQLTVLAMQTHNELVAAGIKPESEEYWDSIDTAVRISMMYKLAGTSTASSHAEQSDKPEAVNHPPHYKAGGVETIDFIEAKDLNYRLGNCVKYISRAGRKAGSDPVEDLEKAMWYLSREIEVRRSA